jgi:hypothetical protein
MLNGALLDTLAKWRIFPGDGKRTSGGVHHRLLLFSKNAHNDLLS